MSKAWENQDWKGEYRYHEDGRPITLGDLCNSFSPHYCFIDIYPTPTDEQLAEPYLFCVSRKAEPEVLT